jgi:hypothetical protein
MITKQEASREHRLRRMAERQGLELHKSRRRDPRALDYGRWKILDERGKPVAGTDHAGRAAMTLDEIENYLTGGDD